MITILGAGGLIGGRLCAILRKLSVEHYAPARDEPLTNRDLGHVIYCIGVTADFRRRTFDTVDAHVCELLRVLRDCDFHSLLYLSSTRVYGARAWSADESNELTVTPRNPDDLYNTSKLMGESLALNSKRTARIARISNVYGDDFSSQNFLSSVIHDAVTRRHVRLRTSEESEKDYIHIDDVVDGLIRLATEGRDAIYNLASGRNVTNRELMNCISEFTGCTVAFEDGAPTIKYPTIDIHRMRDEFGFRPSPLSERIGDVIHQYQSRFQKSTHK
jgi:nucleoside-diphosphate-sugar epimerase